MTLNSKNGAALALTWIATLAAAYLLGGSGGDNAGPSRGNPSGHAAGRRAGAMPSGGIEGANGASGSASSPSSPSSSSLSGVGRLGRGSTADRILRLLGGASGVDLKRAEFEDLAKNLSLDEVRELIGEIAAMDPSPAQRDAYHEVLSRWAELDATAALDHVGEIEAPKLRRDATMNVLRHWAAVDPASALALVEGEQGESLPEGALAYVFRGIGNSPDTTAALEFIASLDGSGHEKSSSAAISELFERNDAEVIEWAASLPEGDLRNRSIQALVSQWARYDPAAAKAWLDDNTDDSNRAAALASFSESWARNDPQSAAAWASGLAEADTKGGGKVLENVIKRWMDYDLASAAEYLVEQEPSPALDGALERYISRIRTVDADATLAWAESISDPKRRNNAIRQVAKTLRGQNPQAFAEYVSTSPAFTEVERMKLLGIEKPKPRNPKGKPKQDREKKRS